MKIDIITLHRPANCGSVLQGYALNRYLQKKLKDDVVELIDYVPAYMENEGHWFRAFLRKVLFYIPYCRRKKNFQRFVEDNCKVTEKEYRKYEELRCNPPKADIYITGSDQLWNPCFPCGNDPAYYLDFVTGVPKLAYATSLGNDKLSIDELTNIAKRSADYQFISVREKCHVEQLKQVGVKDVKWVCDPTFLLPAKEYNYLAVSYKHLGKYVAVYLVEQSDLLDNVLDEYRNQGYRIVGVGGYLNKYKCDIKLMDAGPAEFLGLIRDASFVVATSFHATVFSLIFHRDFAIIPPVINTARIEQLLSFVGLENRIITSIEQIPVIQQVIQYDEVLPKIDMFIEESKEVLLEAIESAKRSAHAKSRALERG